MNRKIFSLKRFLIIYAIVELVIFVALCHLIGPGLTVILVIATSFIGLSMLRQNSQEAFRNMQRAQRDPAFAQQAFNNTNGIRSLACIFLILPGFLTDLLGLLLLLPSIQKKILRRMPQNAPRQSEQAQIFEGEFKQVADNDELIDDPQKDDDK